MTCNYRCSLALELSPKVKLNTQTSFSQGFVISGIDTFPVAQTRKLKVLLLWSFILVYSLHPICQEVLFILSLKHSSSPPSPLDFHHQDPDSLPTPPPCLRNGDAPCRPPTAHSWPPSQASQTSGTRPVLHAVPCNGCQHAHCKSLWETGPAHPGLHHSTTLASFHFLPRAKLFPASHLARTVLSLGILWPFSWSPDIPISSSSFRLKLSLLRKASLMTSSGAATLNLNLILSPHTLFPSQNLQLYS